MTSKVQNVMASDHVMRDLHIRYLGNKLHSVKEIVDSICKVSKNSDLVADLFCGTSVISRALRIANRRVLANDILSHCVVMAKANLLIKGEPQFSRLLDSVSELNKPNPKIIIDTPYDRVLAYLNSLKGAEGFFYKNYSAEGSSNLETPRKYFTEHNAKKIDVIRQMVKVWHKNDLLENFEHELLLSDLFRATNRIANIAGTYGYFLKIWYDRALLPLELLRSLTLDSRIDHVVEQDDANKLAKKIDAPVVYLDPPYTKRQYSAYYHILETLAAEDEPKLVGKSGLRPWKEQASDYCYKRKAVKKLKELIKSLKCEHIFVSYSEDGHIQHDELLEILSEFGSPRVTEFDYNRYKSNNGTKKNRFLKERLYYVKSH